jgi:hypothetical protein
LPLLLIAACGNSRTPLPNLAGPVSPGGFHWVNVPAAGIRLAAPNSWSLIQGRAPLVVISSGPAVVAVWAYPTAPARPGHGLAVRRHALIRAARARDPALRLIRSRTLTLGGSPAIELDAFEHVAGQLRRVRSTHLFFGAREIVLDEYAPPAIFHAIDHEVFSPLKRSLLLAPNLT